MGGTDLRALNAALFRELERVEACGTPEEIERECERAKAVSSLAGNIIANSRTVVKAAELSMGAAEMVAVRDMLMPPGAGDE